VASPPPPPKIAAPAPPAPPAAAQLAALPRPSLAPAPAIDPRPGVRQALAELQCARVQAAVEDGGVVRLAGHMRDGADRVRLERRLAALPGVRRVEAHDLRILGDPYCRILNFLSRPGFVRSTDQHDDLAAVGRAAEAGIAHFAGGMPLSLGFSAPNYDSYVYVDYFSADGSVAHVLPSAADRDNRLSANQKLHIGQGGRGLVATIGPPYGLDVVVALASSKPLPLAPRPVAEGAAGYLAALDAATAAMRRDDPGFRVEYAYFLIYTAAPGAPAADAAPAVAGTTAAGVP
jgi:hypothetical protein